MEPILDLRYYAAFYAWLDVVELASQTNEKASSCDFYPGEGIDAPSRVNVEWAREGVWYAAA